MKSMEYIVTLKSQFMAPDARRYALDQITQALAQLDDVELTGSGAVTLHIACDSSMRARVERAIANYGVLDKPTVYETF